MMNLNKRAKAGTVALIATLIVLTVIVIINALVLLMPKKYTQLDVTSLELYTLSDTTIESVPKIDEEINIYLICSGGEDMSGSALNNMPQLSIFLGRYAELNRNIKVEIIDPIENPNFTEKYTDEGLEDYSIIVESARRYKVIDLAELYYYYNETYGVISADEYQNFVMYMTYYGGGVPELTTNFDGESKITAALDYVTTDRIPAVYELTGHGEAALSATLVSSIEKDSMTVASLDLLTSDIPEDAECIIINVPTSDINADEAAALSAFLEDGGTLFVSTAYTMLDQPNLIGVLAEYGLSAQKGMIVEGDTSMHYNGYPIYLLPTANTSSPLISSVASAARLFAPYSHAVLSTVTDKNITYTPLFSTSSEAYTIADDAESADKTEDSLEGAFDIAVHASDADTGAQIIWFGVPVFTDNANSMTGGNYQYFVSALSGTVERERIVYNIPANTVGAYYLLVNQTQATFWGAVLIIIIPLAFAVLGVVRWQIRRKR
ncbi:MAG: hypothetical protein E7671_02120 [Ruminococcaceae bacterium]|nr:hypothetical protein [Oscillospiraceae bacterium]